MAGAVGRREWIGFDNFQTAASTTAFWKAVRHHGVLLLALPLITIAIALFFAFLLNVGGGSSGGQRRGVWGSEFYRVVFFFPQVLAVAIIAVLFQMVYRPDESGLINGVLVKLGLEPVLFLVNPNLALWSIIAVLVWQAVGFYVVLFSAGMASIPTEIYEAAELDGASRVTLFFRVTCRCSGTPSRWPGSTSASRRSTRSPSSRSSRWTAAGRTAPPRCWRWRSTATPSSTRVRLRLGDGRRAVLPHHHVRGADAAGDQAGKRRVLMGPQMTTLPTDAGGAPAETGEPPAPPGRAQAAPAREVRCSPAWGTSRWRSGR